MPSSDTGRGAFPWQHIPAPGRIFGTATVGERGQIAIPAEARKALSIKSGDKVVVFGNRVSGSLTLVNADVFEGFADFFLTKLNKLGEHAEAFFAQFTAAADAAGDGDAGDDDADAAEIVDVEVVVETADEAPGADPAGGGPRPPEADGSAPDDGPDLAASDGASPPPSGHSAGSES
ncbi:MAG: AbrB/MazE/SpoVT family DNA-binding domain-containing protein [Bifidobacteriaceae bacterium]|jgi:AbrB family looped-hinge helix DNA binding protein|nr:AbrB/MazE/SpoVT family DNA-binding domain-containing protein [Bifidobacteriaceae bacterium]